MSRLRDLPLVDAAVLETATFADAVAALFASPSPAVAVLDAERRVVGVFSENDILRGVFPGYLAELHHTAFLRDEGLDLAERAASARDETIVRFARTVEPLDANDSEAHAAERLMHCGEQALPVTERDRFLGMLSVSGLCHARLDSPVRD